MKLVDQLTPVSSVDTQCIRSWIQNSQRSLPAPHQSGGLQQPCAALRNHWHSPDTSLTAASVRVTQNIQVLECRTSDCRHKVHIANSQMLFGIEKKTVTPSPGRQLLHHQAVLEPRSQWPPAKKTSRNAMAAGLVHIGPAGLQKLARFWGHVVAGLRGILRLQGVAESF